MDKQASGPINLPQESPVGPVDAAELERRIAALELARESKQLTQEDLERTLRIAEIQRRIRIRWTALSLSIVSTIFMATLLVSAANWYFWGKLVTVPSPVAITMFLAPIVSITTVTIILVIGAFRRKGEDIESPSAANLAAEGIRAVSGG